MDSHPADAITNGHPREVAGMEGPVSGDAALPNLSANALRVLEARYLRRDSQRRMVETPARLFERVAVAVASAEAEFGNRAERSLWEQRFHNVLASLEFLPNSPTLMNAGTALGQLSACFVIPVPDTMEGIFEAVKQMALVQRTGGGTGFSFSRLRPKGDLVASTGGESSGPVSFMKVFDAATEHIKQGGRRRGANMGVLRVDHPDVIEFIEVKLDGKALQNFNLSVGITDEFMKAVSDDAPFALRHPCSGRTTATIRAGEIFDRIVDAAWRSGDPGVVFLDAINRANPTPQLGEIESTNPCGEVPLLPWESCNLGSINLARMLRVRDGAAEIDWQKLAATVRVAVRFLDNVIEINNLPEPHFAEASRSTRKLGLGVMGFAEALIRLGIPYGSPESLACAAKVMECVNGEALRASAVLAESRGVFPAWRQSVHAEQGLRLRNATRTAIAPTGTLGIIADTTPGIEPLFALAYRRINVLDGHALVEVNPLFQERAEQAGLDSVGLIRHVLDHGSLADAPGLPPGWREIFATALEIPPDGHLEVQAAFQRHVDNAVSKTINLPHECTREDVARAYRRAWELGLKGVTIYRYGSRSSQVLELGAREAAAHREHASRCDPEECRLG